MKHSGKTSYWDRAGTPEKVVIVIFMTVTIVGLLICIPAAINLFRFVASQ